MDQSLYAPAKETQWSWPEELGEDSSVLMLRGLHIEMATFNILGQWVEGCGWTSMLELAEFVRECDTESMLKASPVKNQHTRELITARNT